MNWYVYILRSQTTSRYYIGSTNNLKRRLFEHNSGKTKSLWKHVPLEIIYSEVYTGKTDALGCEKQIKSYKSGEAFKKLLTKIGYRLKR